ncbi:hypothetical protein OROGR_012176 [Orobanche gracilis]
MLFQSIFKRTYRTMTIMHNVPKFPLANELRLIIAQNPFDVNIHGYWNVYLEMIKKKLTTRYLVNEFPVLPRDGLSSFMRHAFYDEYWFKENYFQLTCTAASRYIGGDRDLRSFLLQRYQPGVKYPSIDVNKTINAFVGATTKICFQSDATPPTLGEVGILYSHHDDSLLNHPDSLISNLDMVVVAAPP